MKIPKIICQEKDFVIRKYRNSDIDSIAENANNINVAKALSEEFPHPYQKKDAKNWIELCKKRYRKKNPDALSFVIEVDGKAVGSIGFHEISYGHKAEFGYWLGEKYWGKKIMTRAVKKMVDFGFSFLGLKKIVARVYDFNLGSKRVLEKNGFHQEGYLKQDVKRLDKTHDVFLMAKFKNQKKIQK